MRYLALDQSLCNTGWSLIEVVNGIPCIINYGVIKTTPKMEAVDRYTYIINEIEHLVLANTVSYIFTETIFIGGMKRIGALRHLIIIESSIHVLAKRLGIEYQVIGTTNQKEKRNKKGVVTRDALTGWITTFKLPKGKKRSTDYIKAIYPELKINEHVADSMLIGATGVALADTTINHKDIFNVRPRQSRL